MPSPIQALFAAAVMFLGSTVLSTIGFGIGMTTIPLLLFAFEPQTVIVVVNTVSLALFALIVSKNRAELPFRRVLPSAVSGLIAVPFGVIALKDADATLLKIAITATVIALTLLVASNVKTPIPRGAVSGIVVGFLVSVSLNALGIGGPIMALYVYAQRWRRNAARGALSLYFLFVETAGVVGYGVAGLLTWERIALTLIAAAPVVVGFWLGSYLANRMNDAVFRRATVAGILIMCALVLAREISAL